MVALGGAGRVAALSLTCGMALVGCGTSTVGSPQMPTSRIDPARMSPLSAQFPAGFTPSPFASVAMIGDYASSIGDLVGTGAPLDVVPAQCRTVLKPVDGRAGAQQTGSRAYDVDEQSIGISANDDVMVPRPIPRTGCDRMAYRVDDDRLPYPTTGIADRIPAPTIDGATTIGLKIAIDGTQQVDWCFVAIIDGGFFINVDARLNPDVPAAPMLSDLLIKSVAAVRGE